MMEEAEKARLFRFLYAAGSASDYESQQLYEPLTLDKIGLGLFRLDIGRIARPQIKALVDHWPRKGKIDKQVEQWFAELPGQLVDLFIAKEEEGLDVTKSDFPDGIRHLPFDYVPAIKFVGLEACNRHCSHCSTMATPGLPHMDYAVFKEAFTVLPPHPAGVHVTFGEPFWWRGYAEDKTLTLGDMIAHFSGHPHAPYVKCVTSGINFNDPVESAAAARLAELQDPGRLTLEITLSDYPKLRIPGHQGSDSARKIQRDTLKFALQHGFGISFVEFLDLSTIKSEILHPVINELIPNVATDEIVLFEPVFSSWNGRRKPKQMGRQAVLDRSYIPADSPGLSYCLSPIRWIDPIPKKEKRNGPQIAALRLERFIREGKITVPVPLALMPGGDLAPGCCIPPSQHGVIANIREPYDDIKRKTRECIQRIDALRRENRLTCLDCVAQTDHIRDAKRFVRTVGPANAAIVPREKLVRR